MTTDKTTDKTTDMTTDKTNEGESKIEFKEILCPHNNIATAAMLGGIAGGVWGANAPFKDPYEIGRIVDTNIRNNPYIPYDLEDATIMSSGGYTALTGAGLGSLGGLAAYKLIEGAGKGVKALKKANDRRLQRKAALYNASNNIKANNS